MSLRRLRIAEELAHLILERGAIPDVKKSSEGRCRDRDITTQKRKIEQALISGSTELLQIKRETEQQGRRLLGEVESALAVLAQARADQRAAAG